jgi:hypothetical protein
MFTFVAAGLQDDDLRGELKSKMKTFEADGQRLSSLQLSAQVGGSIPLPFEI